MGLTKGAKRVILRLSIIIKISYMEKKISEEINKIILGIRHKRLFKMSDISGAIADDILIGEGSPFANKFFEEIIGPTKRGVFLGNKKKESFSVDPDNFILELSTKDVEKTTSFIKEKYVPYIKDIFKKYKIIGFDRFGLVFEFEFDGKKFDFDDLIKKISNNKIETSDDMELRFSKKMPNKNSGKEEKNDFDNVIYTFQSNTKGAYITIDFQRYFNPEIPDSEDLELENFLEEFIDVAKKEILTLIEK